jgi:hypothetical protein
MRGRLAAVAFASISLLAAATAAGGHGGGHGGGGGGGSHSSSGHSSSSSHTSGGGGGDGHGRGRAWIGARLPSSFKPSFADSPVARGGGGGSPTVASGSPALPRPWPGRRTALSTSGGTTSDSASNPAAVFLKSLGEFALYTLLTPGGVEEEDVDVDLVVVPEHADPSTDPCEECPLDAACGACVGYGGYACQDNPSPKLDRCVSTAPRDAEPAD